MAPLRYAAKFDPFLSLDCAPTPSTAVQSKEREGSIFAIWQPWLKDVTIVAATNRPDMIDPALMRPGRFDRLFYVPLPDAATRAKVFEVHTRKKPVSAEVSFGELVDLTKGYSGAEIEAVCNEAGMKAIEEDFDASEIERRHFERAMQCVTPRIDQASLSVYQKFSESRTVK